MPSGSRRAAREAAALLALRRDEQGPRLPAGERTEPGPDGQPWTVRTLSGQSTDKAYRCPGCDHEVAAGTPHAVAWPQGRPDDRRHWHSPCWQARGRRGPRR